MSHHRIVLLGPPACGKGTVARRLSETLGIPHVSTGQMFREAMAQGGPLGEVARQFIDRGQLVPDDVTMQVVQRWLEAGTGREEFILDGVPRTIGQAQALDRLLHTRHAALTAVILIELEEAETLRRVLGRLACESCGALYHQDFVRPQRDGLCDLCGGNLGRRADDTEATTRQRLQVYRELTLAVIAHYERNGLLRCVDGNKGKDNVYASIMEFFGS